VADRKCMNAILFVLRTNCQWNALDATGICSSSTPRDRYQAWGKAGVFHRLWKGGMREYDRSKGLDWAWQSLDGAMTKAPLGVEKCGPNPTEGAKNGVKRSQLTEANACRWVVERARSWMNRFRCILTRWEEKVENYLGLLHLVRAIITYRCARLFG
jgi:transposase